MLKYFKNMAIVVAITTAICASFSGTIFAATTTYISTEQYATNTSCTPAPLSTRQAVDLQNDPWQSAANALGYSQLNILKFPTPTDPDRVNTHPTTAIFPGVFKNGVQIGAQVSLVDVAYNTLPSPYSGSLGNSSMGTLNTSSTYRNPYTPIPASGTLQDCAPYPQSLYDTDPSLAGDQYERQWNALTGEASTADGVLFNFDIPLSNFGAWFGDMETRTNTPAYMKLFDASGNLVLEQAINTSTPSPSDTTCGGPNQGSDLIGCGNQATRWVGFVSDTTPIKYMLVTVGDDDSCAQVTASQCDGSSEHLSFIGGQTLTKDIISIDKSTTSQKLTNGDEFSYAISVSNQGEQDATNLISVTDSIPSGLELISASGTGWTCTQSSPITCTTDQDLLFGQTLPNISITVKVSDSTQIGIINNKATVTYNSEEQDNDDADVEIYKEQLSISKAANKTNFYAGELVDYTILVSAINPEGIKNIITVTDILPTELEAISIDGDLWDCSLSLLTCTTDQNLIQNQNSTAIHIITRIKSNTSPSQITNTATASVNNQPQTEAEAKITVILRLVPGVPQTGQKNKFIYPKIKLTPLNMDLLY
jgi:uncharacterized repeat protein (TIGR01451 family)